ncbi:ABC transporter ATP-binding protein [Flectobacillus longus]|uniref:ABC transporter ATP-binding protein n=1 Tax=Flectobacillus longus TaxID=2984207 RepID=UPI0024B79561|nr:ABC transporter ATP-binding protein [Flectobacillus longus]MDI9878704.1 ABC transporter ATP-binding protein [Flectobacillus longus]
MQLTITNLNKTYSNGVHAINNVNLTINQGMFGLLGPNGAGKSSLMRTIATLQEADSGSIMLGDINVLTQKDDVRKTLGYLPQEFGVYPKIDALTLLDHLAVLKGITNKSERKELVESLLQKTNLWEARTKNLGGYSGGMKQRFGIAQALIASPKLIIVDEPTAGLDPAERNRFLNLLSELGENTIVILSTHIVEDVKELCSDMAIINRGQVLYKGNPFDAMTQLEGKVWQKRITKAELNTYKEQFTVISDRLIAGTPVINVLADTQPEAGFVAVNPDLEDVYFGKIFANA